MFVAAKNAGVKRVIFASSIHAISGHPKDVQAKTNEPPNPGDLYGMSFMLMFLKKNVYSIDDRCHKMFW
jgi:nucleoside-diphosphate-sugar epimerase